MPQNIPVDIADLIMSFMRTAGLKAAFDLIVARIPFLGWGPIGWIVAGVVDWVGGYIYNGLEKFVTFNVIDYEVLAEDENYQNAVTALKAAQAANDAAQIAVATTQFNDTLGKLIHFDGS